MIDPVIRESFVFGGAATTESQSEAVVSELLAIYYNAGKKLTEMLSNAALSEFQRFRYGELFRQVQAIIKILDVAASAKSLDIVRPYYAKGMNITERILEASGIDTGDLSMGGRIHTAAVKSVSEQMAADLIGANQGIEQSARRILQATQQKLIEERAINKIIAEGIVEGSARREVSSSITSALKEQMNGGKWIVVNGRKFKPEYYAELVARTRTREAVTQGTINTSLEFGVSLFQVSVHEGACIFCQRFQGKVYSLDGSDLRFPRLTKRPPYHPHCRHILLGFVKEAFTNKQLNQYARLSESQDTFIHGFDDYRDVLSGSRAHKKPFGSQGVSLQ